MWPSCHVSGIGSWGGWDLAGALLGTVGPLLFLAVLAGLAVVLVVRQRGPAGRQSLAAAGPGLSGREIAQARYARGEITREQYRELLDELNTGKAGEQ